MTNILETGLNLNGSSREKIPWNFLGQDLETLVIVIRLKRISFNSLIEPSKNREKSQIKQKTNKNNRLSIFIFSVPPSSPKITGLPRNETLREGQSLTLTCTSYDGSPKPDLKWYQSFNGRNLKEVDSNFQESPTPTSVLRLTASREDNQRKYR